MNGTTRIVFDTCAVVKLLNGEYNSSSLIPAFDEAEQYTSVIARIELFAKSDLAPEKEKHIRTFLETLTVFPITKPIEDETIKLRRATKIKLPDAIIVATAIVIGATLLIDDAQLKNLVWPGIPYKPYSSFFAMYCCRDTTVDRRKYPHL
ncbi:type II toxin-antitoxin system VapC family toxin [Breznakiellaceae bacterium SP9]